MPLLFDNSRFGESFFYSQSWSLLPCEQSQATASFIVSTFKIGTFFSSIVCCALTMKRFTFASVALWYLVVALATGFTFPSFVSSPVPAMVFPFVRSPSVWESRIVRAIISPAELPDVRPV